MFQYVPEGDKAAGEMRRVTRPGGTVAACTWDAGGGMEVSAAFWDEVGKRLKKFLRHTRDRAKLGTAAMEISPAEATAHEPSRPEAEP